MNDIVSELEALVGQDIFVDSTFEITNYPKVDPHDGVRWVYLARW